MYGLKSKFLREDTLRLLLYFTKFMKCGQFYISLFRSDSGYDSNDRLLSFVLNYVTFSKSSQTLHNNETLKFCSTHVSRKFVRRFWSKSKIIFGT